MEGGGEFAGAFVDLGEFGDGFVVGGSEFGHFAGADEDAGIERGDGFVVVFDGVVEGFSELRHVVAENREAFVNLLAQVANRFRVFRDRLLPPAVFDGFEEGDEGGGGGDDDFAGDAVFEEGGVVFAGGVEEGFSGEEEDDEFGGVGELGPVRFGSEILGAGADEGGVTLEMGEAGGFVGGGGGVEESAEDGFAVDDDLAVGGEVDDHVGAEAVAVEIGGGGLFGEVAAVGHAGEFDEFSEGDFAPLSADVGAGEGGDELGGLGGEGGLGGGHDADLLAEFGVGAGALGFHFGEAFLVVGEHFFEGFEEGADLGFALVEGAGGFGGEGFEFGFGHLEEGGVGFFEGVARDGGEGVGEFLVGVVEEFALVADVLVGGGELGEEGGDAGFGGGEVGAEGVGFGVLFGELGLGGGEIFGEGGGLLLGEGEGGLELVDCGFGFEGEEEVDEGGAEEGGEEEEGDGEDEGHEDKIADGVGGGKAGESLGS